MDNLNRPQIQMEHLSDREVLLLTAQNVNGIMARLDKMNGKVAATEKRVNELESWKDGMSGAWSMGRLMIGSGGLVAVVALIVALVK